MGNTVVKSSMIVYDISYHPRSSRTTDNQHDLRLPIGPTIPKMPQSIYKTSLGSIKTRKLINEYDSSFALLNLCFQQLTERKKHINPSRGFLSFITIRFQSRIKH